MERELIVLIILLDPQLHTNTYEYAAHITSLLCYHNVIQVIHFSYKSECLDLNCGFATK